MDRQTRVTMMVVFMHEFFMTDARVCDLERRESVNATGLQ